MTAEALPPLLEGELIQAEPEKQRRPRRRHKVANQQRNPKWRGPGELEQTERRQQVLALRRAGLTIIEIGIQLDIHKTTVWNHLERALEGYREQSAIDVEHVKAVERSRLERLMQAVWPAATAAKPDLQAIDRALRIMERRAKMDGLDAPERLQAAVVDVTAAAAQAQARENPLESLSEAELLAGYRAEILQLTAEEPPGGGDTPR